jgi:hypothetical protein
VGCSDLDSDRSLLSLLKERFHLTISMLKRQVKNAYLKILIIRKIFTKKNLYFAPQVFLKRQDTKAPRRIGKELGVLAFNHFFMTSWL